MGHSVEKHEFCSHLKNISWNWFTVLFHEIFLENARVNFRNFHTVLVKPLFFSNKCPLWFYCCLNMFVQFKKVSHQMCYDWLVIYWFLMTNDRILRTPNTVWKLPNFSLAIFQYNFPEISFFISNLSVTWFHEIFSSESKVLFFPHCAS